MYYYLFLLKMVSMIFAILEVPCCRTITSMEVFNINICYLLLFLEYVHHVILRLPPLSAATPI